jgi:hypothetical protein
MKIKKNNYLQLKKEKSGTSGSVILAAQEAEIRRILVPSQPGQIVHETLSEGVGELVQWLKAQTLSSSPRTAKKKERKRYTQRT